MNPVRVAVIDRHDLVIAGLTELLSRFPERVELVDSPDCSEADVILYGADDEVSTEHDAQLHDLLRSTSATVIAYGWKDDGRAALLASTCGAHGFAHKQLPADDLVARIEYLHHTRSDGDADPPSDGECFPELGDAGLTRREMEVLSLIAGGWTNREIADVLFLSVNSIKTYVRSAYRKIGVTRRSQAVLWTRATVWCPQLGTTRSRGP